MHLNIKNDEAHRLARELADLTGVSLTDAVTDALRDQLARETRRRGAGRITLELMELGRRYAALPDADTRGADDILGYDENGLPT